MKKKKSKTLRDLDKLIGLKKRLIQETSNFKPLGHPIYHKKTMTIPIFFGDIIFIVAEDLSMINNDYPKIRSVGKGYAAFSTWWFTKNGYRKQLIGLDVNKLHASIISHECTHVAMRVFEQIGQPIPYADNDETFAYLQSWIVGQCYRFLKKKGLKSKIKLR